MPPGSSGYGTGTHVRYRPCNNPSPICNGDYCIGDDEVTENCRGKQLRTKKHDLFIEIFYAIQWSYTLGDVVCLPFRQVSNKV